MYFITNSDGYIVAASKELLEKIGSRDICSISSAIKNKQFIINNESKEVKISNLEYLYSISNMYSAFGELNLYNLTSKSELAIEEDESIEYLKKIKEGSIKRDDENFSIPSIISNKEEPKKEIEEDIKNSAEDIEKLEIINEIEDIEVNTKPQELTTIEEKEPEPEDKKLELTTNETIFSDSKVDTHSVEIKDSLEEHNENRAKEDETIELTTQSKSLIGSDESANEDKEISEDSSKERVEIDESVANLLKDIEEIDVEERDEKVELNDNIIDINTHKTEEIIPVIKDEIIKTKEEDISEAKEIKKGPLSKIKSKLFPWSSSSESKEIELEEDNNEKELDRDNIVKSDIELDNKDIVSALNLEEDKNREDSSSEIKKFTFESELEAKDESKELELVDSVDSNEIDADKTLVPKKDEVDNLLLEEDNNSEIKSFLETSKDSSLEEEELSILKDTDKIDTQNEDINEAIIKPIIPSKEDKESLTKTEDELIEEKEDTQDINISKEPKETLKDDILHKLIHMQVDSINLDENAKKLSIDLSNYKLLLENFIDELDNYKSDLSKGEASTVSMLIDASELLSLSSVTDRLKKLSSSRDNSITISELDLIKNLLREKLKGKVEVAKDSSHQEIKEEKVLSEKKDIPKDIQEPKEDISSDISIDNSVLVTENKEQEIIKEKIEKEIVDDIPADDILVPTVPEDAIDIISAKDLLEKINLKRINFEPQRAVSELNLPKTLILEFVNDFISQAKDHLGQLVDAYKQGDIKTLQTTAHMLKGAASNLRLDPIAEVLFKIQKSNSLEESGELLKKFVANLKGLEVEVEEYEKESNED